MGRYPHEYLSVSVNWTPHAAALLFPYKLGWYYPSQTISISPFLIETEIHDPSDSPYLLSPIHIYAHSFHMFLGRVGFIIWINTPWFLLVPHIILPCLFNWWFNYLLRWVLFLCLYYVCWITPRTYSYRLGGVSSPDSFLFNIKLSCCWY